MPGPQPPPQQPHVEIRDFVPADAEAWVRLWNEVLHRQATAERLLSEDAHASGLNRRWVAEQGGELLGLAHLSASNFAPPGYVQARLLVAPAARRQGVGQALWERVRRAAQAAGATGLSAEVDDTDAHSLSWAQRRGFAVAVQRFASALDLRGFDAGPFAADVARVRAQGITLTDLSGADDATRERYLNFVADRLTETPDLRGHPRWPLAEVEKLLGHSRADWLLLAVSPVGEWLGTTALVSYGPLAYNQLTATHPQARGRGLALPLKLEAIERAQAAGLQTMRTNNHSQNAPMLAVNRRLGFVPQAGKYELHSLFAPRP